LRPGKTRADKSVASRDGRLAEGALLSQEEEPSSYNKMEKEKNERVGARSSTTRVSAHISYMIQTIGDYSNVNAFRSSRKSTALVIIRV
jgi:hypothetical protein